MPTFGVPAPPGPRSAAGPRRQSGRLVGCLLAFAACLLLGNIALVVLYVESESALDAPRATGASAAETAYRFYDAVNAAIRTGDAAPVSALLAPDFADTSRQVGVLRRAVDLPDALARVRTLAPRLHLRVDDASPRPLHDEVVVRLTVSGVDTASFLGLALPAELANLGWGPVETLRIVDGLVVERWTDAAAAALEPLGETALPSEPRPSKWVVAVLRLTVAPHSAIPIDNGDAARYLLVETGALTVTVNKSGDRQPIPEGGGYRPPAGSVVPADPPIALTAGADALTLPWESYAVANGGGTPSTALVVARVPTGDAAGAAEAYAWRVRVTPGTSGGIAAGVTEDLLVVALVPGTAGGDLAVGRVALGPRETLTWTGADRPVVLALDRGQLRVTAPRAMDGVRAGGGGWSGNELSLQRGDGALVSAADPMEWSATSGTPAAVVVVTFGPSP